MALNNVSLVYSYFADPEKSQAISEGDAYVGNPDTDPEIGGNQKQVYHRQEDGSDVPVSQPLQTGAGGVILINGSPAQIVVDGNYSLKVLDKQGAQKYYDENRYNGEPVTDESLPTVGIGGVDTLKQLENYTNLTGNERAFVSGFYASTGNGGGVLIYDASRTKADHNGGTIIAPEAIAAWDGTQANISVLLNWTGTGTGVWVRDDNGPVNPEWFGALGDDAAISTLSIQAAHNTGRNIEYPNGGFVIDGVGGIQLSSGAYVRGQYGGRFSDDPTKGTTRIKNDTAGGGIFWFTGVTGTGSEGGPQISGFRMIADYPIKLNDREVEISDTGGAQVYLLVPEVSKCGITARVTGTGYGIELAKCFDGLITQNEVTNFEINLILAGSDINSVNNNRFQGGTVANIVDYGTGTFGSQNEIRINDILIVGSGATHIISNSRHVRIYDNHLESQGGDSPKGFIDLSRTSMPAIFGVNSPSLILTCDATDNRLGGMQYATEFIYRFEPTTVSARILDSGQTGLTLSASVPGLKIDTTDGFLPVRYNSQHPFTFFEFRGEEFGKWQNFKTSQTLVDGDGMLVEASSYASLRKDATNTNDAGDYTRYDGDAIVLLTTHTVQQLWYFPQIDGNENVHFNSANTYNVTFDAKTDSSLGDSIRMARILNDAGSSLVSYALTEQYQQYTWSMTGAALTDTLGIYFTRNLSTNGNIKIRNLKWTKA